MSVDTSKKSTDVPAQDSVSDDQINKLVDAIARSQHNHRDLIDNLDQAVFTFSLEGEVRVANRRLCEILAASFPDLIGHRLSEFIETPSWDKIASAIPEFLSRGSWRGTVPVRLKRESSPRYFECW